MYMLQFNISGLGCLQTVADSFWIIDGLINADSLLGAEDSGKDGPSPFNQTELRPPMFELLISLGM